VIPASELPQNLDAIGDEAEDGEPGIGFLAKI